MIKWLKERLGINDIIEILAQHDARIYNLEEPPKPPPVDTLPFYMDHLRRAHPTKTDHELQTAVWLKCNTLTWFYGPTGQKNDEGWMLLDPARPKEDHEIHAGQSVLVYRWAFPADGGNVREVVYHIDGKKMLIDIRAFEKPE